MRELIRAQRTVKQAMHAGNQTLAFADKLQKADNKTRLKLLGKVAGFCALGFLVWFIREFWRASTYDPKIKYIEDPITEEWDWVRDE